MSIFCWIDMYILLDSDSDSDKFIQQKYIQVPYQVYMSFLEIQITL